MKESIVSISKVSKKYEGGFQALKEINLEIMKGEIIALLGPNGAGKTTLISTVCGIVRPSAGTILVDGYDIVKDFRKTRSMIGLVPQELTTDAFETVWNTVSLSRGLFGKAANAQYIEKILRSLSLWDKKDSMIMTLSGGMKRRVLIAKALSHEPIVLFLDEPTAGVDVELRKDMWAVVKKLRASGVTIILTTHYIEEAEEIADRIGIINKGQVVLVEEKKQLMQKLGKKQLSLMLENKITTLPTELSRFELEVISQGERLVYTYSTQEGDAGIVVLIDELRAAGITIKDIESNQSSLEDIFVQLVSEESQG
ncbi:MAG: ABC transporter ATP-binding protein [Cellvibrionaceae bacterium]